MKSVVDSLIRPESQYLFSWTGKGGVGITKTAFEDYTEIIALVFAICHRADNKYTMANCMHDLKYTMCKNGNAVQRK